MSLVAFRARNHPQQPTRDDVDDRRTPRAFFDPLHERYRFTVDAAASVENALLPYFWTRDSNALVQQWRGHRVWCNPPYSNLAAWVQKAWVEMQMGGCHHVSMLLPANRCEQRWWQDAIEPLRDRELTRAENAGRIIRVTTKFLPGRMRFGHPESWERPEKGDRPPFGCVLVTWTVVVMTRAEAGRETEGGR